MHAAPWHAAGRVGLLGDAAHAIVPFYGQGANCAFEDVVELDRCLDETGGDWAAALPLFERRRRDNTEAIAEMALDNFVEMRDKVASPVFRLAKRVEHGLETAAPGRLPLPVRAGVVHDDAVRRGPPPRPAAARRVGRRRCRGGRSARLPTRLADGRYRR